MTDRYNSFTVILGSDIREDDAEDIINAIKMIKGVAVVTPIKADAKDALAKERARLDLIKELFKVLNINL